MARYFQDQSLFPEESKGTAFLKGVGQGLEWGFGKSSDWEKAQRDKEFLALRQREADIQAARDAWNQEIDMARYGLEYVPGGDKYAPAAGAGNDKAVFPSIEDFRSQAGMALGGPQTPPGALGGSTPSVTRGITHGNVLRDSGGIRRTPQSFMTPAEAAKAREADLQGEINRRILQGDKLEDISGSVPGANPQLSSEDTMRAWRYKNPQARSAGGTPEFSQSTVDALATTLEQNGQGYLADLARKSPELVSRNPGAFLAALNDEAAINQLGYQIASQEWAWMQFLPPEVRPANNLEDYAQQKADELRKIREYTRENRVNPPEAQPNPSVRPPF